MCSRRKVFVPRLVKEPLQPVAVWYTLPTWMRRPTRVVNQLDQMTVHVRKAVVGLPFKVVGTEHATCLNRTVAHNSCKSSHSSDHVRFDLVTDTSGRWQGERDSIRGDSSRVLGVLLDNAAGVCCVSVVLRETSNRRYE